MGDSGLISFSPTLSNGRSDSACYISDGACASISNGYLFVGRVSLICFNCEGEFQLGGFPCSFPFVQRFSMRSIDLLHKDKKDMFFETVPNTSYAVLCCDGQDKTCNWSDLELIGDDVSFTFNFKLEF